MSVFIRRYLQDPGEEVLLEIESVNILDLDPPAALIGVGAGTVQLVGEFENGPFATNSEVSGPGDLLNRYGGFGFTYNGVPSNNPCARSRKADLTVIAEAWNGNSFIQLSGKKFARLIVTRVDTSVGAVEFNRQAFVVSGIGAPFSLTTGQILALDTGADVDTATFTGLPATVTGVAGTFPTTFAGGETLTLGYDNAPNFTTTFTAGDQTAVQVAARINIFAGFTFADTNGGQLRLTGVIAGLAGRVRVVSGSAGVLAILGLTAATTNGTGNVQNIAAVTNAEVISIVQAAMPEVKVEVQLNDFLRYSRIFATSTDTLTVDPSTTAVNLGLVSGQIGMNATGTAGIIPAGTVVTDGVTKFVTMQDVLVTAALVGPYSIRVRHALDDGTGITAAPSTVNQIPTPPDLGSFEVNNPLAISVALTESQIDAQYTLALAATVDVNAISRQTNIIYSARQSNTVRKQLRANVLNASANGCFGRITPLRTPMNTLKDTAKGSTGAGVGATRDQRVIFCYPQANTFVPQIALIGAAAGGFGFTDDGNVDVGADGVLASVMSQLPPEEDPGQTTTFTALVNGLESGANAQGFTIDDYKAFKKAGICAIRVDDGVVIFQSGVTSVDPAVYPQLTDINRRRMADFIQDTIALRGKAFGKKLSTFARRKAYGGEIRMFLVGLLSAARPENQRIDGFTVDTKSRNTQDSLGKGLFRIVVKVRTLSSLKSIVLETTIGSQVTVEEQLPQAA